MNLFENLFCGSSLWRHITRKQVLPWLLEGADLGEHVLEIGAGAGAATEELLKRTNRVTSLEFSRALVTKLAQRARSAQLNTRSGKSASSSRGGSVAVLQGDASRLPFPNGRFSAVIAVLMLHHLPSRQQQERAFVEAFRVLRPAGLFIALDIQEGWIHRIAHIRSVFVPIAAADAPGMLTSAGFSNIQVAERGGTFRVVAKAAK